MPASFTKRRHTDQRAIPMVAIWFRPISDMAERFCLPFGEDQGFPIGRLEEAFHHNLNNVRRKEFPFTGSAEDYRSFLTFFLNGAAIFQNIFRRLPFAERWSIIERLEETGSQLATSTTPAEKRHIYQGEAAYGRVPAAKKDC